MKSYLDLVPIFAKVHRKQSRMSVFCIVLAVFLVTTIFGMADMFIRSQILQSQQDDGNWHIAIKELSKEEAALIAARPDIEAASPYGVLNYKGAAGYALDGKSVGICGSNEAFLTKIFAGMISEGVFPQNKQEALVTKNAKERMELKIGDSITLLAPDKTEWHFRVSGFLENTAEIMSLDSYGIFLETEGFRTVCSGMEGEPSADNDLLLFVQFANTRNIQKKIADLKEQCHLSDEQISENSKLLGMLGQSRNSFMMTIYVAAAVLAVLVLFASILMIASSLNSSVAQRTEFFGLLRCIGATPKQVMRLVRKEALTWCLVAIPIGTMTGVAIIWILCAILRYLSPEYFKAMPIFGVSLPSIATGISVGLLTVMLAARSPAKRAGKVSALAAVSGSANELQPVRKAANTQFFKIDIALGIHHAKASRKNLVLMTGSFAFSIILFLSFSVTIAFMQHALTPLQPWKADLSIISPDNTCSVDSAFLGELEKNPMVASAYGRKFAYDVPATVNGTEKRANLLSYEHRQFAWAKKYLLEGSLELAQNEVHTGLLVYQPQSTIQVGDTVAVDIDGQTEQIKIVGLLSDCPFGSAVGTESIICSEATFWQISGKTDYTIIDIQLKKNATDEDVSAIRQMAGSQFVFADERLGNSSTKGTYYCFWLFVYGFLVLIALIAIFNVVNSIAMSVAARTRQYGAFRAIGLSHRQLANMVISEACTYAVIGSIVGTAVGLICNKILFDLLVNYKWGDAWTIPYRELGIILLIMFLSILFAVYGPIKKLCNLSIVETISAQ